MAGPAAIQAQVQPATFWWDASVGSGSLQVSCDICADDIDAGPSIEVAAGAYATTRLAVGVEFGGWTHRAGDVREQILRGGLTLRYAPDPMSGWHLLGGLGWLGYTADEISYNSAQVLLGGGWSFPISSGWSVGNRLTLGVSPFGSLMNDDAEVASGVRMGFLRFSVFVKAR